MSYINGFILAVPTANKQAYADHARSFWPLFRKYGALRMMEAWGDTVPDGVHTSFPMAVKLQPDETVVFSWIEWPDKATSDACHATMPTDPEWAALGGADAMPFDGKRMIWGSFTPLVDLT